MTDGPARRKVRKNQMHIAKIAVSAYDTEATFVLANSGDFVKVAIEKRGYTIYNRDYRDLGKGKREFRRLVKRFIERAFMGGA